METVNPLHLSRRALLAASAGALACGRQKASGFRGYCFVANSESKSIAAVDLNHFHLRKQIPLDGTPSAVLTHNTRLKAYALAPDNGTVYEIDSYSMSVSRRAKAGNQAAGMMFAKSGDALWVLYRDPIVLVEIPLDSFRPTRRISLPDVGTAFDISRDNQAAIICPQAGRIHLASLNTAAIEHTIQANSAPLLARYRSDGKNLLAGSSADRSVTIFDVPTGKVVVRLPLPLEPQNFCFSADEGQLFVSGNGVDAVVIIYPFSTEIDQTVLAGHAPGVMAVTPTLKPPHPPYLLVANPESDKVTVFDIDTRDLVAIVQVGRNPRHICMTPDDEYALVVNYDSGDLALIRTKSLISTDGSPRRFRSAPLFNLIPVGGKPVSAAVLAFT